MIGGPAAVVGLPPLFAAGFGNTGMLFWGLAALVPIVLHIWSRKNYQTRNWAATRFLLAALQRHARRMRMRQWLLLTLRIAIMTLAALALADPVWQSAPLLGVPTELESTHYILIVDGSYSMGTQWQGITRFHRAQQICASLVEQSRPGDGFSLILMAEPSANVIGEPSWSKASVLLEIDRLQMTHAGAGMTSAWHLAREAMQVGSRSPERYARTHVYIITDLALQTWDVATLSVWRRELALLPRDVNLSVIDVGQEESENMAVTSLQPVNGLLTLQQPCEVLVTVKSFADRRYDSVRVSLVVDHHEVDTQFVDVPPKSQIQARFRHRFVQEGEHLLEARLPVDGLETDNHRFLAVDVKDTIRVLCIGGEPADTHHLALALAATGPQRPSVEVKERNEAALRNEDLQQYDCVFVCNMARMGSEEKAVFEQFLHRSRGLVFFLGDRVQADSYNLLLASADPAQAILPATIGGIRPFANYRLDPLDYRHPMVQLFRGQDQAGLLTTPVWQYFELQPLPASQVAMQIIAGEGESSGEGEPLVVERRVDGGAVVIVGTAASPASKDTSQSPPAPWNAWSTWPSFPPIVHSLLESTLSAWQRQHNVMIGESLRDAAFEVGSDLAVDVFHDEQVLERVPLNLDGARYDWVFGPVQWQGGYSVTSASERAHARSFAVNIDHRESEPARASKDSFPDRVRFENDLSIPTEVTPVTVGPRESQLFRCILSFVLLLMLIEPLWADRVGGRL
ncbi:MAG: BatA domain-containing protein [Planctomycetales bacterium]|nr:BatA domain-containing protein [Planctomycetales bacterium]